MCINISRRACFRIESCKLQIAFNHRIEMGDSLFPRTMTSPILVTFCVALLHLVHMVISKLDQKEVFNIT